MKRWILQSGLVQVWVFVVVGTMTSDCLAQSKPVFWTKNAISISAGRFWCAAPKTMQTSGPVRDLRIVGLYQWNLGLTYEHYSSKRWSYGAILDVTQPFFSVEADVDDPKQGQPPGANSVLQNAKDRWLPVFYNLECLAFVGKPVHVTDRWRLDVAFEAGVNPSWSTLMMTGFGYAVPSDTGDVGVFVGALGAGWDIWPMFGLRLNASYRLANHNRLMLALEGRMTATNFWDGGYNMYGLTDQRSEGTFSGKLAYIGFRMGYAFTWGGPRKPKWLRQQEEAEKAIGPPSR